MPFLEEDEWLQIEPLLKPSALALKNYRSQHNCDLRTARRECTPQVTKAFEEMTGMKGIHFDTISHHRLKDWGQPCSQCGHLLRTAQARFCAQCGREKSVPDRS